MHTGDHFGPFIIRSILGRGGMGFVFEGVHIKTGKRYAVKTAHAASPILRRYLQTELYALSRTRHPFIVRVHMHGVEGGVPWYAMDLLEFPTLRYHIWAHSGTTIESFDHTFPQTPHVPGNRDIQVSCMSPPEPDRMPVSNTTGSVLDVKWIVDFFCQICEALNYLHSLGIVHADIKPENIFVTEGSQPILVDFGISSNFNLKARETCDFSVHSTGTLAYAAPEQLNGKFIDPRTDLYALGCTLYECLTGKHPFVRATKHKTIATKMRQAYPPLSSFREDIPKPIEVLLDRLLAPLPHHRIGYAVDVAQTLSQVFPKADAVKNINRSQAVSTYLNRSPLIGRKKIRNKLNSCLRGILENKGSGLLIEGESGIGKTRLLSESAIIAQEMGIPVMCLSCTPISREHHAESSCLLQGQLFKLLSSIKAPVITPSIQKTERRISPKAQQAIFSSTAVATSAVPGTADTGTADKETVSQVIDALIHLLKQTPALLVIDDFQWAEDSVIKLISQLNDGYLSSLPLLVILFRRTEPLLLNSGYGFRSRFSSYRLEPLTEKDISLLVCHMLASEHPPTELLSYIWKTSGGNPLLAVEHLQAAVDCGVLQRNRLQGWTVKADAVSALSAYIHPSKKKTADWSISGSPGSMKKPSPLFRLPLFWEWISKSMNSAPCSVSTQ